MPLPRRWESLRGPARFDGFGSGSSFEDAAWPPGPAPWVVGDFSGRAEDLQAPGLGGSLLFRVLGPPRLMPVAHRGREAISGCRAGIDGLVSGKRRSRTKVQKTREGKGKWRADVSS